MLELQSSQAALQETLAAVSSTLNRERELREQHEKELTEAQETIKVMASSRQHHQEVSDLCNKSITFLGTLSSN